MTVFISWLILIITISCHNTSYVHAMLLCTTICNSVVFISIVESSRNFISELYTIRRECLLNLTSFFSFEIKLHIMVTWIYARIDNSHKHSSSIKSTLLKFFIHTLQTASIIFKRVIQTFFCNGSYLVFVA